MKDRELLAAMAVRLCGMFVEDVEQPALHDIAKALVKEEWLEVIDNAYSATDLAIGHMGMECSIHHTN